MNRWRWMSAVRWARFVLVLLAGGCAERVIVFGDPPIEGSAGSRGGASVAAAASPSPAVAVDAAPRNHTFVVTNTGQVPTGVPMPQITGTVDSYAITSTTCSAALAPMATCNVVVRFDPSTVGSKPGSLVVTASPGGSDGATLAGDIVFTLSDL